MPFGCHHPPPPSPRQRSHFNSEKAPGTDARAPARCLCLFRASEKKMKERSRRSPRSPALERVKDESRKRSNARLQGYETRRLGD